MEKREKYFSDFETTVPEKSEDLENGKFTHTRVWAAAIAKIGTEDVKYFNDIEEYLDYLLLLEDKCIIYFHNLKFDSSFIIDYLMREKNYKCKKKKVSGKNFKCLWSDGMMYELKVSYKKKVLTFRDSLKILPFSEDLIAKSFKTKHQKLIGSIDYKKQREKGYIMNEVEKRYLRNDILIMTEALAKMDEQGLLEKMTIGSMCMSEYKKMLAERNINFLCIFPELSSEEDKEIRRSYKGGWCYCKNPGKQFITGENGFTEGYTYDVNSLYPWAMHSLTNEDIDNYKKIWGDVKYIQHRYPIGHGKRYENFEDFDVHYENNDLFIVNFDCNIKLKKDHLPFLQLKNNSIHSKTDTSFITNEKNINLTLTSVCWELMFEQYDVEILSLNYYYVFKSCIKVFDFYIDKWYKVKEEATINKDPVMRQVSKLFLNNLYGKFGTNPCGKNGTMNYDEEEGDIYITNEICEKDSVYIPVASFITDYARSLTIRSAQLNFDLFEYADTDSIHCHDKCKDIFIDDTKIGSWKCENSWQKAKFVRQKTYIEYFDEKWIIKCAGCPDSTKERLLYKVDLFEELKKDENDNILNEKRSDEEFMNRFDHGLQESGKLVQKLFKGGRILYDSIFTLI